MKVGDILSAAQVNRLPVGSVVVHDEPPHYNTVVRTDDGFEWLSNDSLRRSHYGRIHANNWTLVHLTGPIVPLVGEVISEPEQFAALPVGSVCVDEDDLEPNSAPAVKVDADSWLYWSTYDWGAETISGEELSNYRVIYIPERADTGTSRSAA